MIGTVLALGMTAALSVFGSDATEGPRAERAPILSMKERAELEDRWLAERLDTIVPSLMVEQDIDMWILIAREYNEDPVVETMLPASWLSARRRTILMFARDGEVVERYAVARYPVGDAFPSAWDPETEPDQWARVAELVAEHDPETIAISTSKLFALADGLSHQQAEELKEALPRRYRKRLVSGEELAVGWLETRTAAEMETYPGIVRIAHDIIDEAFSQAVITPGETTTEDVQWWMRDRVRDLGLTVWFHPSISIQRAEEGTDPNWPAAKQDEEVIMPGDLLWVDFGIRYLGLNTDTQQHAYVLRPSETQAPEGLRAGLAALNQATDHLTAAFEAGKAPNAVLGAARSSATEAGLRPTYYSHPIGYHGHGAGSPIGWWDDQGTDHPMGFRPIRKNTAWSIELNNAFDVPEWDGQEVSFRAEEDAFFDGESVRYLDGRQTRFHLIPSD